MDSSDASLSSSASRYGSLLKQVSELQADLSRTVSVVTTLRREKETLTNANENLKKTNEKIKTKYVELRREYLKDHEQRVSYDSLVLVQLFLFFPALTEVPPLTHNRRRWRRKRRN